MKVRFPLSVKVGLWLLLNLALLGGGAAAFLFTQGGRGWSTFVVGTPGDRLQSLGDVIAGEVSAASPAARDAVLARFSTAYHADFLLARSRSGRLAGAKLALPAVVQRRLEQRRPGPRPMLEPPEALDGPEPRFSDLDQQPQPPDAPPPLPPGELRGSPTKGTPGGPGDRFLIRAGGNQGWWIGLEVRLGGADFRTGPTTLLIHASSFWRVLLLLDLSSWILVACSVLAGSVLIWLPLVRSITRHIQALTTATEHIAEGRFSTRVPADRRDELGRLGESVNTMAARLDTLVNGQKRFLADVAHELGSPIGRLQVATEILAARADPDLQVQVGDVREEVQHMATLVNELLAFTRAGMQPRGPSLTPVAVESLFAAVVAREDATGRVQRRFSPSLQVLADEPLLLRAVCNLVRNALRYSDALSPVVLSALRERDAVVIAVEDEGPGVPAAALERLGEPFYRPEFARTRETGGVGLGLAIVRTSVTACGGQVRFTNRSPRGFRAELRLPAAS
ncbi:HAMP domain-containing sensor histidine kinase [Opitutus sp. ER46]|uniref:HAMP domain-containing sensor histidine kinase n=1 Tax=Opitutus sp. ER46 TaxID=2161864 RepID=UPI000D301FD0|nr:HAMP domain-containing sensor histidine kinase [Opitutus sp. ER46]PTX95692.1 sensor histidine kinase [Opitutus sp. ER46]